MVAPSPRRPSHAPPLQTTVGSRTDIAAAQYDGCSERDLGDVVHAAIRAADARLKKAEVKELVTLLDTLDIRANNAQVTLHVILHGEKLRHFMLDIAASSAMADLKEAVLTRCGKWVRGDARLSWLDEGCVVKLDFKTWPRFVAKNWCTQPWVVHLHDVPRGADAEVSIPLPAELATRAPPRWGPSL
jgi:hypothetical protein